MQTRKETRLKAKPWLTKCVFKSIKKKIRCLNDATKKDPNYFESTKNIQMY